MLTPQITKDGSYTFFSPEFEEAFHSIYGAKQEAEVKFVVPTRLRELAQTKSQIKLLDICYGLGYNSAAAMEAIWQVNPQCKIELKALEIAVDVPQSAISHKLLSPWQQPIPQLLANLATQLKIERDLIQALLLIGDARQTIQQLVTQKWQADAVFLDPFSPPKCPQLWTVQFIDLVARCLQPQGRLATYSCAAAVRTAMGLAGLKYGSTTGMGRKSPGTIASWQNEDFPPLSLQEQEHLQTKAAIPYQDLHLTSLPSEIKQQREARQAQSNLESASKWRKRWYEKPQQES